MPPRTEKLTKAEGAEMDADLSCWRTVSELAQVISAYANRFGLRVEFDPRGKSLRESAAMLEFAKIHGAQVARWDAKEPADFRLMIKGEEIPFQLVEIFQEGVHRSAAAKHFMETGENTIFNIDGKYIENRLLSLIDRELKKKSKKPYPPEMVLAVMSRISIERVVMEYLFDRLSAVFGPYTPKYRAIVFRTNEVTDIFDDRRKRFPQLPCVNYEARNKATFFQT